MKCHICGSSTHVVDSRITGGNRTIARRRECEHGHRFSTHETFVADSLKDLKRQNTTNNLVGNITIVDDEVIPYKDRPNDSDIVTVAGREYKTEVYVYLIPISHM